MSSVEVNPLEELRKGFKPTLFILPSKRKGGPNVAKPIKVSAFNFIDPAFELEFQLSDYDKQRIPVLVEQGLKIYYVFCIEYIPCGKSGLFLSYPRLSAIVSEIDDIYGVAKMLKMEVVEL